MTPRRELEQELIDLRAAVARLEASRRRGLEVLDTLRQRIRAGQSEANRPLLRVLDQLRAILLGVEESGRC